MAITIDDFSKIWASTSPLTPYEFSENKYKEGWNFIGGTPPSRQMWDFLQKNNDEKMQYLANNYLPLSGGTLTGGLTVEGTISGNLAGNATNDANGNPIAGTYLPLAGGTMSGSIKWSGKNTNAIKRDNGNDGLCIIGGDKDNFSGATLQLFGQTNSSYAGRFYLRASTRSDASDTSHPSSDLAGYPDGTLTWNSQPLLPVGIVQAFAGTTLPNGWLLCDGSAVSRTAYAKLYAVIGTTYGTGDGTSTFNLPNLVEKFVEGSATAGTEKSAGLPNITGYVTKTGNNGGLFENQSGALYLTDIKSMQPFICQGSYYNMSHEVRFDASRSNPIYGESTTVQPPALTMRYIIKY